MIVNFILFVVLMLTQRLSFYFWLKSLKHLLSNLALWLTALTALLKDPGLVPSAHMVATTICNSSIRGSDNSSGFPGHLTYMVHMQTIYMHIYVYIVKFRKPANNQKDT